MDVCVCVKSCKLTIPGRYTSTTYIHAYMFIYLSIAQVSWSVTGNVLAVSSGDATVTLYKESLDRKWVKVNSVDDEEGGDPTQANVTQQQQQLQG